MEELHIVIREPNKAYIDDMLWLPKFFVPERSIKGALEFWEMEGNTPVLRRLWSESLHHIICPREFINPATYQQYPFPFVDLTPRIFPKSGLILKSKPRDTDQARASEAFSHAQAGILNLACVAGDTVLNINRAGLGRPTTIQNVFTRMSGGKGRSGKPWNLNIPTFIRALTDEGVRLHRIRAVIFKGVRETFTLKLADGKELRATSDHEIMTPGGFIELGNLSPGDAVLVDTLMTGREKSVKKTKVIYKRSSWYPAHPFVRKQWRAERLDFSYQIETHRVVFEAALNGISFEEYRERCRNGDVAGLQFVDPSIYHVHHIDGNPFNNDPKNLEKLEVLDHLSHHQPGYQAFGHGIVSPVQIVSITPFGEEPVYDVACDEPYHNFVANGIVVHNCGKGKSFLALKRIVELGCPALIIVHNGFLMNQWMTKAIPNHIELPPGETIGVIQGSQFNWKHSITIAMIQTLAARAEGGRIPPEMQEWFGAVVFDEVHHLAAPVFASTAPLVRGRRYGLTATDKRVDGTDFIFKFHLGDVFYADQVQKLIPRVYFQLTPVCFNLDRPEVKDVTGELNIPKLRSYMGELDVSNNFRAKCIQEALDEGRKILAISHSKAQLRCLHEMFSGSGLIISETTQGERSEIVKRSKVTFAIANLGLEGLDDDQLDTLFVLLPFGSRDSRPNDLQQVMGRIQREQPGKNTPVMVIFDDVHVKPLHSTCNTMRNQLRHWNKHVPGMPKINFQDLPAP